MTHSPGVGAQKSQRTLLPTAEDMAKCREECTSSQDWCHSHVGSVLELSCLIRYKGKCYKSKSVDFNILFLLHIWHTFRIYVCVYIQSKGFPSDTGGKEPTCQRRRGKRPGSVPGPGRPPGGGHGNAFLSGESHGQRGAWWATAHGVSESRTCLKQISTYAYSQSLGASYLAHSNLWKISST